MKKLDDDMASSYQILNFLNGLVAGADHEINNLLMMLQGSTHLLLSPNPSPEKQKLAVEGIRQKTLRIQEVMGELRSILKDGSQDPVRTNTVRELTTKAITLCRTRFKNHRIIFSLNISESLKIEGRETQLVQALLAVLGSCYGAVRQSKDKWVKVEVFEMGLEVVLEVEDSGTAFGFNEAEELFNPFYQSPSGRTGVGLALAKHLIGSHQGTVSLANTDGRPVVRITLPRYQGEAGAVLAFPPKSEVIEVVAGEIITVKAA